MNQFEGYTRPVPGGFVAMVRLAENGTANPILGKGGTPEIYGSELLAHKAVTDHLLRYFNGKLVRFGEPLSTGEAAERLFRKGKIIPVERRGR